MFCPECGLDYEDGVTYCLDCEVSLVDEPEEDSAVEDAEFLPFLEIAEAGAFALVTECLEDAGVAWFVQSEPPAGLSGSSTAMIYVAEKHLDPARKALESAKLSPVSQRA